MKKLGKRGSLESGTFASYACNCNCSGIICSSCDNCNSKNPDATVTYAMHLATETPIEQQAFAVPAVLG